MDKTTKTLLMIIGSLLVLCACTVVALMGGGLWGFTKFLQFADKSTTEDAQEVAQIASEIADFDLPAEFDTQYGMQIASFSMVQYTTSNEESYIFLTQFPAGTSINVDEMMRQIRNNSRNPNSPWHNVDNKLVQQKSVNIRGESATLTVIVFGRRQGVEERGLGCSVQPPGEPERHRLD